MTVLIISRHVRRHYTAFDDDDCDDCVHAVKNTTVSVGVSVGGRHIDDDDDDYSYCESDSVIASLLSRDGGLKFDIFPGVVNTSRNYY